MISKNREIKKLKKEAKEHYLAYCEIADEYSCGLSLAEHISADMMYHKVKFNNLMDELAKLDPTIPKVRL